ncbi:MAG: FAD-dependent oxidoreductase [Opitutales bacterium]
MRATFENAESRYASSKAKLQQAFLEARKAGREVRLGKRTSNLFRERDTSGAVTLDVSGFNTVISVDPDARTADVGGMTPYDAVVAATLSHGLMPAVVPELKSITVGGAVTGGGIESSSFRYGFVHESVREMEILTPTGEVLECGPDNEQSDLFYGFANSYGTLGYALRLRIELAPVAPCVLLTHKRYANSEKYFRDMAETCEKERNNPEGAAFIDGTVFDEGEMYQTIGEWTQKTDAVSDYTFMRPYYRSIQIRETDCLKTKDYIWRWDTDWFWCARAFGMENPALRFLFGICGGLNSRTYWKLRNKYERSALARKFGPTRSLEWVIQDVEIPVDRAAGFQRFLQEKIGIHPFWICPAKAYHNSSLFPLYQTDPNILYINFGFWGGVPATEGKGYHNRLVENKVAELGGKKSLYSASYFTEEDFWKHYNKPAYQALKERYDPDGFFPDLYGKCVLGR